MEGKGAEALLSASRGRQWDSVRALVRELSEERDLHGLAAIAEMSLMRLRQLCERPVTCEALDEMLETLRRLNLDAWETGDEQ